MPRKYRRSPLCTIYRITNTVSGKVYVGQTWATLERRWQEHRRPSYSRCRKLADAITAYGTDVFRREVVTFAGTQAVADSLEAALIAKHDSIRLGYNIREAGGAGHLSVDTRARMRAAHLGKTISDSTRAKLRQANVGRNCPPRSNEHKAKLAAAHRGRKRSGETRERLSLAHLGHRHSPATCAKMSASRNGRVQSPDAIRKMVATKAAKSPEEKRAIWAKMWETRRMRAAK